MSLLKNEADERLYPGSDGHPLAETDLHLAVIINLLVALRLHFRDRSDVYVAGDLLMYYVEGNPKRRLAPDVMVVQGVPPDMRRNFKTWEEGAVPTVVVEVTSKSSRRTDTRWKKKKYESIGVREYFVFDSLGEYLQPRLQGFRLTPAGYIPIVGAPMISEALQLGLELEGPHLRLRDLRTGQLMPLPEDLADALKREKAQRRISEDAMTVEKAARQNAEEVAATEAAARQKAEKTAAEGIEALHRAEEMVAEAKRMQAKAKRMAAEAERTATAETRARRERETRALDAEARLRLLLGLKATDPIE